LDGISKCSQSWGFQPHKKDTMNASFKPSVLAGLLIMLGGCASVTQAPVPAGVVKGSLTQHTEQSAKEVMDTAQLVLPASATGGAPYAGLLRDAPRELRGSVPLVVFMHGSSGLALKAIGEWQQSLAGMGIASLAPNSFALPDRLTYKSPVSHEVYEKVHALRMSEIALAVKAVQQLPWVDRSRMVLAGTSEGATSVARYTGTEFVGRIVYSWSCENNYFVRQHATALPTDRPVLNVMSSTDNFFSASNPWLGNPNPKGHCGDALKSNKAAAVLLIPGAPHTLLNLPQTRHATAGFLKDLLKP
jgi:dienelactone hydrolase